MTEAGTVGHSAWPLSEAEITALHAEYRPQVEAAIGRLPQDLSLPLLADEGFEASLDRMKLVGVLVGLLSAFAVPPEASHWLSIDLAADLLDRHDRLRAADCIGPVAGHA